MQKLEVSFYGGIEMKLSSESVKFSQTGWMQLLHYCSLLVQWKLMEVLGIYCLSVNLVLVPKPCPPKNSDMAWEQDTQEIL